MIEDNSVMAIVSFIMISLGFVNGFVVGSVFTMERETKLKNKLQEAIKLKFEADKEIDILKSNYTDLSEKYDYQSDLLEKIKKISVRTPVKLNPPNSPLVRSSIYIEDSSEDEDVALSSPFDLENKE